MRVRCPKCGEAVNLGGLSVGVCDCGAKVRVPERPAPLPMSRPAELAVAPPVAPPVALAAPPSWEEEEEFENALIAGELVEPDISIETHQDAHPVDLDDTAARLTAALLTGVLGILSAGFLWAAISGAGDTPAAWVCAALLCWVLISLGRLRRAIIRSD